MDTPLDAWVQQLVTFALLLTGALALGSMASTANDFLRPRTWVLHWWNLRRDQRGLRAYIPHMTEREREVISYLLAKNQKTIEAAADGGRAATLLSRGIVIIVARPNQHLDMDNVPMAIPDHFWDVLVQHKDQFPYTPADDDEREPHPWRRNWME